MPDVSPVRAGLQLRCGQCGRGRLFRKYLVLVDACEICGRDLSDADTADGPAFFVGFGVLILLAPFLFILPMAPWPLMPKVIAFVALCSAIIGLSLALLPIVKAVMLNLQFHHKAEEAKFVERD